MKKFLSLILALAVVLCALPFGALTVNAATSGNYTYTVSNGEAAIIDCDTSISGAVTIPSTLGGYPVTSIRGFIACSSLTSITIPDSVTSIGFRAFEACSLLTLIAIPDSVTSIGSSAFYGCSSLTSITIPDSVTSIGNFAFSNTGYYKNSSNWENDVLYINNHLIKAKTSIAGSYAIKTGTKTISDDAFFACSSLTSITVPDSVTSIGSSAFYGCSSLTSITILDSVTSIGSSAFYGCSSLTAIAIPDGVTSIGDSVFESCTSLTSITIPDSVTSIGSSAFYDCSSLTAIAIPDGVTSIGYEAFYNTGYYNKSSNWENNVLYINNHLIKVKDSISGVYVIKTGTKTIPGGAFQYCSSLNSVIIPDSVTSIGYRAFFGCSSLNSIIIPDSVTSIGYRAFFGCSSLTSITIPDSLTSIGYASFENCSSLTSITIPDSVTSISDYAFSSCSSLTSITIHDSLTSIGYASFENCSSLTSITIPDSVTIISDSAFSNCTSLKTVNYESNEEDWNKITISNGNDCLLNAEFNFNYSPRPLAFISILKSPDKISYSDGEKLDLTGGEMVVCYNDGGYEVINLSKAKVSNYDGVGFKTLTVNYKGKETNLYVMIYRNSDLDGDGTVSATDVAVLKKSLLSSNYDNDANDLNVDGSINILDLIHIKKALA